MSASSFRPCAHRLAILMSPVGRFLQCRDCHLSFEFPAETHYNAIAKQFESHLCGSFPVEPKDDGPNSRSVKGVSTRTGLAN